jgi:hypothetical protein
MSLKLAQFDLSLMLASCARPNPALQLTASRARSFGFEVVLCSARGS